LRCPALPSDLSAEARRKPVIRGATAVEVAGRLVTQVHEKNSALKRAIAAHEECRKP
jgi:hypothetical protein